MIKLVMCLRRKPGMTRAQFLEYWRTQHAPLFMQFADVFGTKKYVQDYTLDSPLNRAMQTSRSMLEEYDGIAHVWFESEEALVAAMSSPEGQELSARLLEDESNFIDHTRSTAFLVEEHDFDE
ncbi:MAG: EthD domain-containing protein [Planctomycetota bacterium]